MNAKARTRRARPYDFSKINTSAIDLHDAAWHYAKSNGRGWDENNPTEEAKAWLLFNKGMKIAATRWAEHWLADRLRECDRDIKRYTVDLASAQRAALDRKRTLRVQEKPATGATA